MSKQKPVYLMAGGRSSRGTGFDPAMQAIFREIGKKSPTIAYVGVASGEDRGFLKIIGKTIKESIECSLVMPLIAGKKADIKKAKEILSSADAIFMSGGDVEAGMEILSEKDMGGFVKGLFTEGKLFFGASAGAIMLAREWVRWRDPDDDSTAELFPCMGVANLICDTHAEGDDWEELKAALLLKNEKEIGFGIPTGSCLTIYPDNRVEALGGPVARYFKKNGQVAKMPDLCPV
jgi:cyanophycinase-like exopeptidase